jgi:hypothetical protein
MKHRRQNEEEIPTVKSMPTPTAVSKILSVKEEILEIKSGIV